MATRLQPGEATPELEISLIDGGTATIGGKGRWQVVVVYRGKHCPLCKTYLKGLEELKGEFAKSGAELLVVSADPLEKASVDASNMRLTLPVGYDLSMEQMQALGLYISQPRDAQETDRPFAEPGLYVTNPAGELALLCLSNTPWARPDMAAIASGIARTIELNRPTRGTFVY